MFSHAPCPLDCARRQHIARLSSSNCRADCVTICCWSQADAEAAAAASPRGAGTPVARDAPPQRQASTASLGGGSPFGDGRGLREPGTYGGGGLSPAHSQQPGGRQSGLFGGLDDLIDSHSGGSSMLAETRALEAANKQAAQGRALQRTNQ